MRRGAGLTRGTERHRMDDEEVGAAVRRFPARQAAIEALAARDEEFHSLCADFAEAEAALRHWETASSPLREKLCSEYRQLAKDLADEIEAALGGAGHDPRMRG